jgi:hypothetical protein
LNADLFGALKFAGYTSIELSGGYLYLRFPVFVQDGSAVLKDLHAAGIYGTTLFASSYGGGGYELGAAVTGLVSAVAGKVDKITVAAHTMTIPKLTTLGTAGSISWNAQGQVTSWVDPT